MNESKKSGIEIVIKKLVRKVLFTIKNKNIERSLESHSLPEQTPSMVVIIDRILDDYRKRKVPPLSYNWIRYN